MLTEFLFYSVTVVLYLLTVWYSYYCVKSNVKDPEKIDGVCLMMIWMPIANIGWAIGAMISEMSEQNK